MTINVIQVPPSEGVNWLRRAWALTRMHPLAVHAGMFAYLFLLAATSIVPVLGQALPFITMPVFYVGVMSIYRAVANKTPLSAQLLFSGFSPMPVLVRLLILGVIYGLAVAAIFAITTLTDGGALMRVLSGAEKVDPKTFDPAPMATGAAITLLLYAPVSMLFWMAPQFIAWHGMGVGKALFYSAASCWRNLGAFSMFFAASAGLLILATLVVTAIGMLFGGPLIAQTLILPLALLFSVITYVAFYVSYESMVRESPPAAHTTGGDLPL
jgi:hypothetical protein